MLATAESVRGQGIGSALVHECLRRAGRTGCERLVLGTLDTMTTAQRLYERLGFTRMPERDRKRPFGVHLRAYQHPLPRLAASAVRSR